MPASPLPRLRRLCLAQPDAHEVVAWGEPTVRIRNKLFAMYASPENHHGAGRPSVWCKAGPGNQELMIAADRDRYFRPPYVGPSGWVGVYLDQGVDWKAVKDLIGDAYQLVAPRPKGVQASVAHLKKPDRRGRGH
ncbi:MAG: MmcQ/YjbR family DNA-binding protein [Gemmatimonadales bacterium]